MKKFLTFLLTAVFTICLVSCSLLGDSKGDNPSPSSNQETNKTQEQYDCGKIAYDELLKASKICENMGDAVYGAWYFAIYEADDYSSSTITSAFSSETGISVSDLNKAASAYEISSTLLPYALSDFSLAVLITTKAFELNGQTKNLDDSIAKAKEQLKTMTQKYSDYSEYPSLKSLYSKVDSYATFLKSPTGSFEQLKTTIQTYENDIRTLISDLSFIFED